MPLTEPYIKTFKAGTVATLDELNKAISNSPELAKLAALQMEGISLQSAGLMGSSALSDTLAALSANSAFDAATLAAAGKSLGSMYALPTDGLKKAIEAMRGPNGMLSNALAESISGPLLDIQKAAQAVFSKQDAAWKAAFAGLPAVRFQPPIAPKDFVPYPLGNSTRTDRAPAPGGIVLPLEVEQSRVYFFKLIAVLKTLPASDVIAVLDIQLSQHNGDRGRYVERLAHYVANGAGFEPRCWQVLSYWLKDAGGAAPAPVWGGPVATDAASNSQTATEAPTSPVTPGLSLRQVALLFIYNKEPLNRPKANHAATKAGFTSLTSGQKLMQYYNALAHHVTNRVGVEKKALSDMIKDITAVLPALVGTSRQHAESELQTLKAKR